MQLILTILSIIATWGLLTVLALGLLLILKPLQSVRGSLERIVWGVRAIERQAAPLGGHTARSLETAERAAAAVGAAAAAIREAERRAG